MDDNKNVEIIEKKVKTTTAKKKIIKKPQLISITSNSCRSNKSYRSIFEDVSNEQFICRDDYENDDKKACYREIPYPFGENKIDTLKTILHHGDSFCFNIHRTYPQSGIYADLYKKIGKRLEDIKNR